MQSDLQENTKSEEIIVKEIDAVDLNIEFKSKTTEEKSSKQTNVIKQTVDLWHNIGGVPERTGTLTNFVGLSGDVYAILSGTNSIYRFNRGFAEWYKLGAGVGIAIGVTTTKMYAISVNGNQVWEFNPADDKWGPKPIRQLYKIPLTELISGGNNIYAISNKLGKVWKYGLFHWFTLNTPEMKKVGPYTKYVASGDEFVGLSSGASTAGKVYKYLCTNEWKDISGTKVFIDIFGGLPGEFYGVTAKEFELFLYRGNDWKPVLEVQQEWQKIEFQFGDPDAQYVYGPSGLFAIDTGIIQPGVYRHQKDGTWPFVSKLPTSTASIQPILYNGSGSLAFQPIMADSHGCYLLGIM